jgi:hypothetical protein
LQGFGFVLLLAASIWGMSSRLSPPILWNLNAQDSGQTNAKWASISVRQNVWRPWVEWKSQPPQFDSLLQEVAIVMGTGSRIFQNEPNPIPELYLDTGGTGPTFLSSHPLFATLDLLVAHGITPIIDVGPPPIALCSPPPVPTSGAFDFHVLSITDSMQFDKYHRFLVAFFQFLKTNPRYAATFPKWRFQLHREPDNIQAFDPYGVGKSGSAENFQAYLKLYDWTLSAMRDAGVQQTLDFGNMACPADGLGCPKAWNPQIARWLVDNAPTSCPKLKLPRIGPMDTVHFSFTAYANSQMGPDPRDFERLARSVRDTLSAIFRNLPFRLHVGEGNIYHWPVTHRGDGSAQGAAWNAAIFKICNDLNISHFQQWGFYSADNISIWKNEKSLPSASYHIAQWDQAMGGSARVDSKLSFTKPLPSHRYLDGYAGKKGLHFRSILFHFSKERSDTASERILMTWSHLPPNARIRSRHWRVDVRHGSYLDALKAWIKPESLPGDPYDGLFTFQLDSAQKTLVDQNWDALYRASQAIDCDCEPSIPAQSNMKGQYQRRFHVPANSVSFIEMEMIP